MLNNNGKPFNNTKLVKNSAQCLNCQDILLSNHRHDWVACQCFENTIDNKGIFIDGGTDYIRWGGNISNFKNLSVYDESEDAE